MEAAHQSDGFTEGRPDPSRDWDWAALRVVALRAARAAAGDGVAEDAAQQALELAWRHRFACRTPRRPEPWVRTIARREAVRALPDAREVLEAEASDVADPRGGDVLERLPVRDAVRRLPADERQLLFEFYWRGRPDHEIAARRGIPLGSVKTRLRRARARLRPDLGEVGGVGRSAHVRPGEAP
jgi:RNA polymerase sigma factor (sigma-70 family)